MSPWERRRHGGMDLICFPYIATASKGRIGCVVIHGEAYFRLSKRIKLIQFLLT